MNQPVQHHPDIQLLQNHNKNNHTSNIIHLPFIIITYFSFLNSNHGTTPNTKNIYKIIQYSRKWASKHVFFQQKDEFEESAHSPPPSFLFILRMSPPAKYTIFVAFAFYRFSCASFPSIQNDSLSLQDIILTQKESNSRERDRDPKHPTRKSKSHQHLHSLFVCLCCPSRLYKITCLL